MIRFNGRETVHPKDENNEIFGHSYHSEFIPFSAFLAPNSVQLYNNDEFVFFPVKFLSQGYTGTISNFIYSIFSLSSSSSVKVSKSGEEFKIEQSFGEVRRKGEEKILFKFAYRKKKGNIKEEEFKDFKNFILGGEVKNYGHKRLWEKVHIFVSSELLLNPLYENFYRRINKDVFMPLIEKGATIEYSSPYNIYSKIFVNGVDFKIKSIEDLEILTKEIAPSMILDFIESQ